MVTSKDFVVQYKVMTNSVAEMLQVSRHTSMDETVLIITWSILEIYVQVVAQKKGFGT